MINNQQVPLANLPSEITLKLMSHLSDSTFIKFSIACKHFDELSKTDHFIETDLYLWSARFNKHQFAKPEDTADIQWRKIFIKNMKTLVIRPPSSEQ